MRDPAVQVGEAPPIVRAYCVPSRAQGDDSNVASAMPSAAATGADVSDLTALINALSEGKDPAAAAHAIGLVWTPSLLAMPNPDLEPISNAIVNACLQVLDDYAPEFIPTGQRHRVRRAILSCLHDRVAFLGSLPAPTLSSLTSACLAIMTSDNEDNGVLACNIVARLFASHGSALGAATAADALRFVETSYRNLPTMANDQHSSSPVVMRSAQSLRILSLCPNLLRGLMATHEAALMEALPALLAVMHKALKFNLRQNKANVRACHLLISVQARTLSFIAGLVRVQAPATRDLLLPLQDTLCTSTRQLLLVCGSDRENVLEALRALGGSELRRGVYRHLNVFLDTAVLLGRGADPVRHRAMHELALEIISDIVKRASAEGELNSLGQLANIIHTFALNVHDRTLPANMQVMSLQVVLALVENIFRVSTTNRVDRPDVAGSVAAGGAVDDDMQTRGRHLLVRIFQMLVVKVESLADAIPRLVDEDDGTAPVNDVLALEQLLQVIVRDLQTLLWRIANISGALGSKGGWMFKIDECRLVSRFMRGALRCFALFELTSSEPTSSPPPPAVDVSEPSSEGGALDGSKRPSPIVPVASAASFVERFANVFVSLDPASFRRVVGVDIGHLFEAMVKYERLPRLVIPQQFLGNPSVSKIFADIVMIFVLERLEDMGAPTAAELRPNATDEEKTRSATALLLLNMFRIVAGSLSLYADNEDALLPYMARLVRRSVRLALRCRYKQHYLLMLRHLFRSIGGGKFQRLYETFVPLLPELLAGLSSLQDQAQNDQPTRELAVELCLTVPARLSTLLSYIPLMMHSVVRALESRDDQVVKIGLRTFEFWVDKLNHDYLFVNLASEISSAMRSLCALLRPSPAPFGAAALSLLGKLGGRNRRFLTDPMALPYRDNVHEGLSFRLLINNHRVSLPFSAILGKAVECLRQSTNLHSGGFDVHALNLIKACVPCIFDIDPSVPIDMHRLPVSQPPAAAPRTPFSMVDGADDDVDAGPVSLPDNAEQEMVMIVRRRPKLDALDVAAKRLIEGLLLIAAGGRAQPGPAREAQVYLERLIRFFALTYALDPRPLPPPASAMTSGGLLESERQVVIQALVDQLMEPSTFANERLHAAMLDAIEMFVDELIVLFGVDGASDSAAIDALLLRLMTACYGRSIASRTAGVAGLSILVRRLDERWLAGHTIEVANALIATLGEQTASYQQLRYYDPEDETDLVDSERSTDESFDTEAPTERTAALIEVAENNLLAIVDAFLDQDPSNDAILVNEMAAHLSDPLPSCRYICLRLMEHVAERREIHLGTLLSPILDKLAEPVLHRTLSKVAPSMRVGYVWSACLALRLRPSLVPPDQLVTLVRDTIESLKAGRSSRNRQPMGRASSLEFSRLTVEYISLMAVTVSSTPLSSNDDLRNAVVQSLFNALVDRNSGSRVVVAAKRGLAILCRHHKLPKALLRNCLEPVLRNLADSSTLTMPLLDLLEHLLQLLSHCFNVTLGRTLLDHLFFFSEAIKQMLTVPQPVALPALCKPGDEVRLPCRLLDLFHRLPPAPRQFLTKLVMAVVSLESMLPLLRVFGGHSVLQPSPFRPPLLRFVCKYAAEAVAFFLTPKNLVDRRLSQLFLEILASPSCGVVCETLIMLSDQLLAASFNIEQSQQTQAQQMQIHRQQQRQMRMQESGGADNAMDIDSAHDVPDTESVQRRQIPEKAVEELELQGVNIVYQLVQYRPLWLAQPEASRIVQAVFQSWMAQSNMSIVPDTPTEQVVKRIRLAHCLVSYWTSRLDPSLSTGSSPHSATSSMPISTLWMLLSATGTKAPVDFAFIDAFFMDEIALGLSIMKLAAVVRDFVANVLPPASTPDQPSHSTFTNADRCAGIRLLLLPIARLRPEREVRSIFSSVVGPLIDNADNESHSIGVKVELATLFAVLIERAHDLFKIGTLSQLSSFARAQLGVQQVPLLPTISGDESALQAATLLLLVRTAIASRSSKRCAYLGLYIRAFRCARTHDVCKDALDALATFFHQSFDELALEPPKSQAAHEFAQLHPFTASDQPEADDDVLLSGLFADIDVPAWVVLTGRVASSSPANALEVFRHVLRCDALFVPYLSHLGDALIQAVPLSADLANRQTAFPDRERVPVILDMVDQLFLWSSVAAVHNAELPASPSPPKRQKAPSKTRRTSSRSSSPRFHLSTSSLVSSHRWVASAPSATVVIGILIETFKRCLTAQQPATQAVSSRIITTLATASSVWPTASFAALDDVIAPLVSHLDGASLVHVLKLFDALLAGRSAPFLSESDIRTVMIDGIIGRVFAVPVDDALLEAFQSFLRRLEATLPAAGADGEDVAPIYASLCKGIAAGIQHKDVDTLRLTLSALDLASLRTPLFLPGLNAALAAAQHTLMRRCLQASSAAVSGASASVKKAQGPSGSSAAATGQQHDKPALLCSLRLVERRAPSMREQRKQVLQTMLHLIDKSEDFDIVSSVVVIVCGWISGKHPLPDLTLKEKCNLLVRMSRFEEFAHSGGLADDGTGVLIRLFTAVLDVLHSEVKEGAPNAALLKLLARPVMGVLRSSEPDIHARMMRYLEALAGATVASRLEFIFETSGWATVADRFWLSHGLEMILSLAHADAPLFLSQEHSRLRVGSLSSEGGPAAITSQRQALGKQKDFIAMLTATKAGALIGPMYRLALADDSLARLSWERIFPIAWSLVPAGDQPGVTSVLSRVLSRDDLLKQLRYRPNVVHALLASFDRCDRPPDLRPELISYLGRTFGAWHSASALLDRLVLHPPMQPGVAADHALAVRALIELHSELSEHDVIAGIVQIRAVSPFTRAATALEQYGLWPRAQEEFFGALKSIQGPPGADAGGAPVPHPGADEAVMWEHEWVRCAKHLHQWAQIGDVASQLQRADLVLESASLAGDTAALESLCDKYGTDSHPTIPLSGLMYRLQTMSQQQAALVLRALGEDDGNGAPASDASSSVPLAVLIQRITTKQVSMLDRAMDIALQEWMRRPSFLGTAHVDLLSRFQQLVELREGRIMIDEAGKAFKQNRVPDFKNLLSAWRDRLPNYWDSITIWNEIVCGRLQVFQRLSAAFQSLASAPQQELAYNDTTWTVVKMAETARRQQLPQVCLTWLDKLPTAGLSPAESFAKLREQVKICLQTADEIRSAVSLLNQSPMDRYTGEQCAEMFRLKGEALEHLGHGEESHTAFSSSLAVCDDYGKGWLSWGAFCDQLFGLQKDRQWAEYTITCYLQAVRFHTSDRARLTLARVLWLLTYDKNDGPLNAVFKKYSLDLPVWVWLLWLPQLISSLSRPEGTAYTAILQNVAKSFPQAIYYDVRAYLHERRDHQRMMQQHAAAAAAAAVSRPVPPVAGSPEMRQDEAPPVTPPPVQIGTSPDVGPAAPSSTAASRAAGERSNANVRAVVTVLRQSHLNLVSELEKMLEEMGRCFRPEPQEELLSTVQALFLKCFRQPITAQDTVPQALTENIRRVCSKFFLQGGMHASSKPTLTRFMHLYRERFLREFLPPPDGTEYPTTLTRLMRKLKWWKSTLRRAVSQSHRQEHMRELVRLSTYLARFEARNIEIPGQYGNGAEPKPGAHVMLVRFSHLVGIVRHNGMSFRRIGFVGCDGTLRYFLVQFFVSHITKSDERMMQMGRILNQLMRKSRETRERSIALDVPAVVPLTNRLRLYECDPSFVSLDAVLEHMCFVKNMDADDALTVYRNQLGGVVDDERDAARHRIHKRIMMNHVPPNTLRQYLERTLPTHDALWAFKVEFAKQLGLTSFLTFALRIGDRTPQRIWFSRRTGRIVQNDFYPSYTPEHAIDHAEQVPFRLTPNLAEFCTPFLIEGVFGSAFISSAACWLRRQHILKNYLNLFLRDDLLSWSVTLQPIGSESALDDLERSLRAHVSQNTTAVLNRVQSLMPSSPPPPTTTTSDAPGAKVPAPINAKIQRLVEQATSIDNLSAMPATWHPWF